MIKNRTLRRTLFAVVITLVGAAIITLASVYASFSKQSTSNDTTTMGPAVEPPMPMPAKTLAELHGAHTWHAAGFTGRGVGVGVIDSGFEGFSTIIFPGTAETVTALCFPNATVAPTRNLFDCEEVSDHGTKVVETMLTVAPDVKIYISNPQNRRQLKQAVNWMTANHNFNIKVINHSRSYLWDGPGDGTSPDPYSPLRTVDSAIQSGVLWVGAAGNAGQRSWFSRTVAFDAGNLIFDSAYNTCNKVHLQAGSGYTFQLRWSGEWPGTNQDLDLYLYGPRQTNVGLPVVAQSEILQGSSKDSMPFEMIYATDILATGQHCLYVRKKPGSTNPSWVQLQLYWTDDETASLAYISRGFGGLGNPAESNNGGMLTVGDAELFEDVAVRLSSSKGPAPEPHPVGRIEPDVVAITYDEGTSFAAPVVTGLAALVIQALGDQPPSRIAQYIKEHAIQRGTPDPNNVWGHGLAFLPQVEIP